MRFRVELHAPLPSAIAADYLAKLPYISESLRAAEFADDQREVIVFDVKPGREADAPVIATRCVAVADTMSRVRRFPEKTLLERRTPHERFTEDPHPLLASRGDLVGYGVGRYGLGPRLVALLQYFDGELSALAAEFSARPVQFPALIGADTLARCGYFKSFPHSLCLVTHLREDLDAIRRFANTAEWTGEDLACEHEDLSRVTCLLSPAVCFHWYAALQGRTGVGPHAVTAIGKCFRYESANMVGLRRLWDFTMREIVFVGSSETVLERRERCISASVSLLDRWRLAYTIKSATDPFFTDQFAEQSAFQLMGDLKFEVQATLPYARETLAVGSFNYHGDFFGKCFEISARDAAPVHTGCVAFGLERLILAFLAQHGVDPASWPEPVRTAPAIRRAMERLDGTRSGGEGDPTGVASHVGRWRDADGDESRASNDAEDGAPPPSTVVGER